MSPELIAVTLGLFSAVTLASANLAVKFGADILVGRAILSCSAALLIAPAALFVPLPDTATWAALALAVPDLSLSNVPCSGDEQGRWSLLR